MPASSHSESAETGQEAADAPALAQRWLADRASLLKARSAVLLLRQGDKARLGGRWPTGTQPPSALLAAARQAFKTQRVLIRANPSSDAEPYADTCVAFQLRLAGRPAVVAFQLRLLASADDQSVLDDIGQRVLRREDDGQGAPAGPVTSVASSAGSPKPSSEDSVERTPDALEKEQATGLDPPPELGPEALAARQGQVLQAMASVLDQQALEPALHELANSLARAFACQRVTIGLTRQQRVRIHAVSGEVDFDARSALFVDIAEAMTETRLQGAAVRLPAPPEQPAPRAHMALAETLHRPALLSLPLVDDEKIAGVLLLERDRPFSQADQDLLVQLSLLVSPVLTLKRLESLTIAQWSGRLARRSLGGLLGRRRLGLKVAALVAAAVVSWSLLDTGMFRVDADARIEAERQRVVVSAFPSYLSEVTARPGDLVQRGDVLARLDSNDLELERIKWQGELDKLQKEYRATLAQRDRSKVRVLQAQLEQARSQLDLLDVRLKRAVVRAPIDGVVVSGDWSQALGKPVDQGEKLFEVAALDDFDVVLMVDESDISWMGIGQTGRLRLRSLPGQTLPFEVADIAPVSEPRDGSNRFRVKATFDSLPQAVRPGMGGVAKIDIEPQALGWIWTRKFRSWLRLQYWRLSGK